MSEEVEQITIERVQNPDGSTPWNWAAFGVEAMIAEGDAVTLEDALVSAVGWVRAQRLVQMVREGKLP